MVNTVISKDNYEKEIRKIYLYSKKWKAIVKTIGNTGLTFYVTYI